MLWNLLQGWLKWGAVLCAFLLLPWMSVALPAASQMNTCCPCCQNGPDGSKHDCGMQGKAGISMSCGSCSMPFLISNSLAIPTWQASSCPLAMVTSALTFFPPNIFHPPEIS